MHFLKPGLHIRKKQLVIQMIAAMLFVMLVLYSLDSVAVSRVVWAVGAGSLASSAYLVFAMPHSYPSKPHRVFGGYVIGVISGLVVRVIAIRLMMGTDVSTHMILEFTSATNMFWLSGAFAVGLSMLLMLLFGFEHPPAVGFSVVFVIELRHYSAILVILAMAALLALIRYFFRNHITNLSQ